MPQFRIPDWPISRQSVRILIGVLLLICGVIVSYGLFLSVKAEPITFIYIHGTDNNTPEDHRLFNQYVVKLHPYINTAFTTDPLVRRNTLLTGQYSINIEPVAFYWGGQNQPETALITTQLAQMNKESSFLSKQARSITMTSLHDALWLERRENRYPITEELFQTVQHLPGSQHAFILMGHSAGSLISLQFLLERTAFINIANFFKWSNASASLTDALQSNTPNITCLQALEESHIIRQNPAGKWAPFLNDIEDSEGLVDADFSRQFYKTQLSHLNKLTQSRCLPENSFRGVVTFGSPAVMFFSAIRSPNKDESYLFGLLGKYILEHNTFWMNVNHAGDPFALSLPEGNLVPNLTAKIRGESIHPNGGFIVSYDTIKGGANVSNAHEWYWNHPESFASHLLKAYHKGYFIYYLAK